MNDVNALKDELAALRGTQTTTSTTEADADPSATPEERAAWHRHLAQRDLMQEPFDLRTFVNVRRVFKELGLKGFQN